MKVIAIKDMSAGNESVGEMWKETKIVIPALMRDSIPLSLLY